MIIVVDFDGHLEAEIEIINNKIKVLRAVDGWGEIVNVNNVKIKNQ